MLCLVYSVEPDGNDTKNVRKWHLEIFSQGNIKGQVAWFHLFEMGTQAKGLFTDKGSSEKGRPLRREPMVKIDIRIVSVSLDSECLGLGDLPKLAQIMM